MLLELHVEALPLEIPHEIEVDLDLLVDPNGIIRAGDLQLPPNVGMLTDSEDVVVRIEVARTAEEFPARQEAGETPADAGAPGESGAGSTG